MSIISDRSNADVWLGDEIDIHANVSGGLDHQSHINLQKNSASSIHA